LRSADWELLETLTIGILGRPVEVMQLVEIVEEVQSKVQWIYRLVFVVSARSRTACSRAASFVACHCSSLNLEMRFLFPVQPSRDGIWLANGQCLLE